MTECETIHPDVWDVRGSFVCGKPVGHDGPHESRPSKARAILTWEAEGGEK